RITIPGLPNAKMSKVPIPLRSNLFVSKPNVLQQIMSPFSTLAYYTNNTEREKRKVLYNMSIDKKEEFYREFMTYGNLKSYFPEMDSVELMNFISYSNEVLEPSDFSEEYILSEQLKNIYPEFKKSIGKDAE